MDRSTRAAEYFMTGYNCAQSVSMAFSDLVGMDEKAVARLASPFGGGMGRMREVCGAVSGMLMIFGILYGYDTPNDDITKGAVYDQVQQLATAFREQVGTIICREILDNPPLRSQSLSPDRAVLQGASLRPDGDDRCGHSG